MLYRMLYEFHAHENKKKPGSVYAAYLLYGTQNAKTSNTNGGIQQDGEDISMASSPFLSSSMPQDEEATEVPPVKVMTVVREENLEGVTSYGIPIPIKGTLTLRDSCEGTIRRDPLNTHLQPQSRPNKCNFPSYRPARTRAYEFLECTHAVRLQPTDNHKVCARRSSGIQRKVWRDSEPQSQGQHRLQPLLCSALTISISAPNRCTSPTDASSYRTSQAYKLQT